MERKPVSKLAKPTTKVPSAAPGAVPRKIPSSKQASGALTKDWVELEKNVMICSGSYSQAHKKFKGSNQQGAATCTVACCFAALRKMNTWTKQVLDDILEVGTNLYVRSRQIPENRCLEHLTPTHIYKYFFINDIKIAMKLGVDVSNARIPRDFTMFGKVEDLVNQFFQNHPSGIFACQKLYFAIWKIERYFFVFDPTEHTPFAGKWTGVLGLGFCYCIRTTNVKTLTDILLKHCPLKQINKFTIYPCMLEKYIVVNTTPPETLEEVQPIPLETSRVKKIHIVSTKKKEPPAPAPEPAPSPDTEEPQQETIEPKKSISKSRIPPERPKLASVTNFVELMTGKIGILRASTHQRDPKFTRYMGAQGFANAIAALTMLRQYKSKVWIRRILDDVLKLGETIHHDLKKLPPGEVPKKITLNEKEYAPKCDKYGIVGRIESEEDKILNLHQALKQTLLERDCCILIGPNIVAIWKEDNKYYMFDPEERDPSGKVVRPGEPPGVACVTWYTTVPDLIALYLSNMPPQARKERFMITKIAIKDYMPIAEDWYNFKALTFNKWILRGNFSQQDRRFPPESRNAQCTANATMALAFKELKQEKDWNNQTVDQVLVLGDEFYRGCVEYLQECGRFKDKYLMVDELKRNFAVENKRVNLEIDDCLVNGIVNAKSETGIPNLKKGFEEFFGESEAGIVTANLQSMAIWRRDNTYYYYDSHSRNERGIVCGYGTACILRMVNIEDLTNALMTNLGSDSQNLYNISRVVVKLFDITDDGVVKPPLNYYEAVNDLVAILRSNTSEKDKKYNINSGKQEVPMCLAAIAFNNITPSFEWTKEDVDQILNFGDKLYSETMEANYGDDIPEEINVDDVSTTNVKKQISIGPNLIEFEFDELSAGNLEDNLKEAIEGLQERVQQEGNDVFQSILESQYMIASVWRDDNLFYLFDPRPRDEKGEIYGKDDWSVKHVEPEEEYQEEEGEGEEEIGLSTYDNWLQEEGMDEMAGGDNLGEPEQPVAVVQYGGDEQEVLNQQEGEGEEGEEEEVEEEEIPVEKKGSEFWRMKEEEGKACVMRFSRVEDLIQHIINNSPPNLRQEIQYTLKGVKVNNNPVLRRVFDPEEEEKEDDIEGDWNEFKEIDYGKWILRSVRNFRDALFPVCNRGKQALPMCMVGLAFANLYDLSKFTQDVVDSILAYGDRLYTVARKRRMADLKNDKDLGLNEDEIEMILKDTTFEVNDYPKNFCTGEKLSKWEVVLEAVKGDTTSKVPEVVHNILSGLNAFFEENNYGILTCRNYPVAIWKQDDIYYMFDPHANGPSGSKSPIGVACITRSKDLEPLAEIYLGNLPSIGNNFFEIHAFTFTKAECIRERHPEEKEETAPKIGGFNNVTAGKSILRGDMKLDCTKFDRGVHIHSAPIAFVALALSLNKDPETWTRMIVNEILTVGEELYTETLEKLGDKFDPWSDRLDICRVNPDFQIGRLKVNCAIRFMEQKGIVDVKNSKTPNLRQGLERFFEENSHGVLIADKFILAVWEQPKGDEINIFMFDPNSRGGTGLPGQGGVACVMKFCNAKLASDHIMACMMDIDKTKTEFSIVPIEIVVGSIRTKRKICKPLSKESKSRLEDTKKTSLYDSSNARRKGLLRSVTEKTDLTKSYKKPVCPPCGTVLKIPKPVTTITRTTKPVPTSITVRTIRPPNSHIPATCPDKATIQEQKRTLRKIAEEERRVKEAKRCAVLGRNEMYEISSNQAIIRGLRSINKDRELPVNLVAFIFMKITTNLDKWTYKQIELILEAGYQLYIDSYNAYQPGTSKLGLEHVLRRILLKDFEAKIDIKKPILGNAFNTNNLLKHLNNFFTVLNFAILSYGELLVSIYFKSGYYYLFDPYSRDLAGNKADDGSAMLMRFGDLSELVDKVVKNLRSPGDPELMRYALICVGLQSVVPIGR